MKTGLLAIIILFMSTSLVMAGCSPQALPEPTECNSCGGDEPRTGSADPCGLSRAGSHPIGGAGSLGEGHSEIPKNGIR